jgi:hypothetical protein
MMFRQACFQVAAVRCQIELAEVYAGPESQMLSVVDGVNDLAVDDYRSRFAVTRQ